jgi:hypothetical protein
MLIRHWVRSLAGIPVLTSMSQRTLLLFYGHDMDTLLVVGVGGVIVVVLGVITYLRSHGKVRPCVNCGAPSRFGFSNHAESAMKDISRLCLNCLKTKLADDYTQFRAHALVIEPAANLPCYVFQPSSNWKDRKLVEETDNLLSKMETSCHRCGAKANFLWLTSNGLTEDNAENLFTAGVPETLLRWGNGPPCSVCGRCCVDLICESIESRSLTFLEVCSPRSEDGLVLPMGY